MADDTSATESTATETPDNGVVNLSKPNLQPIHVPPAQDARHDLHSKSRAARLRSIMEDMGEEEDTRVSQGKKASIGKDAPAEEVVEAAAEESESPKGLTAEDSEKRREERREALAKAEKDKLRVESAAEEEAKEEPKKEDELTKIEKERRAKFEKVLAMEAKAQKESQRLRSLEARLAERERELSNNVKRAQDQLDAQAKQYERQVSMADRILKLARENPLELLEQAGAKPEDVANWIHQAADPTVQRMKALEQKLQEKEQAEAEYRARLQQQEERRQREDTLRRVEQEYLSVFDEKDDSGEPAFDAAVTMYPQRELIRLGHEIAADAHKQGYSFTHRDIAEAVNALAQEDARYKKIQEKLTKSQQAKVDAAKAAETASKPVAAPAKPAARSTTILTNAAVQQPSKQAASAPNANYKRSREARVKRIVSGLDE